MPIVALPTESCFLTLPFLHWHLVDPIVPIAIGEPDSITGWLNATHDPKGESSGRWMCRFNNVGVWITPTFGVGQSAHQVREL